MITDLRSSSTNGVVTVASRRPAPVVVFVRCVRPARTATTTLVRQGRTKVVTVRDAERRRASSLPSPRDPGVPPRHRRRGVHPSYFQRRYQTAQRVLFIRRTRASRCRRRRRRSARGARRLNDLRDRTEMIR